jgi:hypothetical protein
MLRIRQLSDGRYRLTLWHHVEPCPEDEERFELIIERSIPIILLPETFAAHSAAELARLCVENTLMAYALVAQGKADLPLWGTYVEAAAQQYCLEEEASPWMRSMGRALKVWRLTAPRVRRKVQAGR